MSFRFFLTTFIFSIFLAYGLFIKGSHKKYFGQGNNFIIETLPSVSMNKFERSDVLKTEGNFFHFWATWCGPCEKELPEFIEFIKSFNGRATGNLLAIKDDHIKVQKLLKRFNLTDSFNVIYDDDGLIMKNFGSLRVPETFLFGQNGKLLKKYVGPQDWKNDYFFKNTLFLINR